MTLSSRPGNMQRVRCLRVAGATVVLALAWQLLMVYGVYEGNWTGLFCIGSTWQPPDELASENLHIFRNSNGYDGQFYLYIAQDPFFRRGFASSIDAPRLRYRRILIPLAAWTLGAGSQTRIVYAYSLVVLAFLFLGAWWLARYAVQAGKPAVWGLGFLIVPATLISLDRMTLDGAMTALTMGFAWYTSRRAEVLAPGRLFALLMAAPLVRETGILLTAAVCLCLLNKRDWRRTLLFGSSAIPAVAWWAFVHLHTRPDDIQPFSWIPLWPLMQAWISPLAYPPLPVPGWLLPSLDRLGMLGAAAAFWFAIRGFVLEPTWTACVLFTLLGLWHNMPNAWQDVYAFGRSFAPLFLLIALQGVDGKGFIRFAPMLLPLPRIAIQLGGSLVTAIGRLF
ncbi:MAG: hypothetical protein WD696_05830 [Bryobacteraceae bacterium]